MATPKVLIESEEIKDAIYEVRGQKVILDEDLARFYGVQTGALNRAVKRNIERFPGDFVFPLENQEVMALKCQNGISKRGTERLFVRGKIQKTQDEGPTMKLRGRKIERSWSRLELSFYSSILCPW